MTTLGPNLDLQNAVTKVLKASAAIKALIGNPPRLWQDPLQSANWPGAYVTIGEGQKVPDQAECIDGSDCYLDLHVWSRGKGFAECKTIAATIWAELEDAALDLAQNRCIELNPDGERYLRDPDGITKHGVVTLRALMEPA
jgi:hypothetical protein